MKATNLERRYRNAKEKLLTDSTICKANRDLFRKFLSEYQEHKLKRTNGLQKLDEAAYKTLYSYLIRFRNMNGWFKNKAWRSLTKKDIQKVYDDLEDGVIISQQGKPYKTREDYYSKIFKSKPFEMIGKADLAREIIQYQRRDNSEVRFITEEDFRRLVGEAHKIQHRLLIWLAFDIGENIGSLLLLKKSDFSPQKNPHTKEGEYRVNLRKETLKRTRKPRSELTNHPETVLLLDQVLPTLANDEELFPYDYRNAKKIIDRVVERSGVVCTPRGEKVTWKDLRSSMGCDLLKKGWTMLEINGRLGHKPSSDEFDRYANFLAIDRHRPKKKVQQFKIQDLESQLEEMKEKERLQQKRMQEQQEQMQQQQAQMQRIEAQLQRGLFGQAVDKGLPKGWRGDVDGEEDRSG